MRKRHIPSYRHHKHSGQAVVVIDGKWNYLGPYDSEESRKEYDRLIAEYQRRQHSAQTHAKYAKTCDELCTDFLAHAQEHYQKNGRRTDEYHAFKSVIRYVSLLFGYTPACEFGPKCLKACREAMVEGRFSRKPLSRKYVNKSCNRIRHIFKWGVEEEIVPSEVLVGLRAVTGLQRGRTKAVERERVRPVEASVIDATIKQLRPMVADMVRIQLLTGMRPGELCQMQSSDIDRTMSDWRYTPSDHKMIHKDCVRLVAIGPKAQEILDKYLSEEPCFVGKRGSRMTTAAFRDAIHRACDKAKVARWNPNQLRHNAATKITSEYDLETARAVLSHSDTKTTEIYAERDYEIAKEVALAVG